MIATPNGSNKKNGLMIRIFLLGVAALMLLSAMTFRGNLAVADEPEVMKRLRGEMVTVFDAGIKRLRRLALDAAIRMTSAADPGPITRVWYDGVAGTFEIEFRYSYPGGSAEGLSREQCLERRKKAVRETFNIGRTIYALPLSFDERVRRRIGILFTREPIQSVKEVVALGQRLSQLTFLRVEIFSLKNVKIASCRDLIAPVVGGNL